MNETEKFIAPSEPLRHLDYTTSWQSPSNIAFIKYWGKRDLQLPMNPSLSMTLSAARSEMTIRFRPGTGAVRSFLFEGNDKPDFARRIDKSLSRMKKYIPWQQYFDLEINSRNSFPHSAGIASSASSMSALAMCLIDAEMFFTAAGYTHGFQLQKASFLARLASGSASRSVFGNYVQWGREGDAGSDFYAVTNPSSYHPVFDKLHDSILIVDSGQKPVSSSAGHKLMDNHPYAESRYRQARKNLKQLYAAMQAGDWNSFAEIIENEALSLHAMMMASEESFLLINAGTVQLIEKIRRFREQSGHKLCFTLDAGPNLHLLYPMTEAEAVQKFIENQLKTEMPDIKILHDSMGAGPVKIKTND